MSLLFLVILALAACGGGGSSSTSNSIPDQNPPLNLTGVVTTLAGTGVSGAIDSSINCHETLRQLRVKVD